MSWFKRKKPQDPRQFLRKVLQSCETKEQIDLWKEWADQVLSHRYPRVICVFRSNWILKEICAHLDWLIAKDQS